MPSASTTLRISRGSSIVSSANHPPATASASAPRQTTTRIATAAQKHPTEAQIDPNGRARYRGILVLCHAAVAEAEATRDRWPRRMCQRGSNRTPPKPRGWFREHDSRRRFGYGICHCYEHKILTTRNAMPGAPIQETGSANERSRSHVQDQAFLDMGDIGGAAPCACSCQRNPGAELQPGGFFSERRPGHSKLGMGGIRHCLRPR